MDVISPYIYCIWASSLYTLFDLYKNIWFTFNVSYNALFAPVSAHFKQSCSENTEAYRPVRFPVPFVIATADVMFSLNMLSYLFMFFDVYTVFVLLPCLMSINSFERQLLNLKKMANVLQAIFLNEFSWM